MKRDMTGHTGIHVAFAQCTLCLCAYHLSRSSPSVTNKATQKGIKTRSHLLKPNGVEKTD